MLLGLFFFFFLHMETKTLFVLLGPTAVGKTALSLRLADFLQSPIISADSRQMFADLPIGTAAPTPAEQALVPHHFVGQLPLTAYYSAAQYEKEALALIGRLFEQHDALLVSGGSMMYIDALCHGIDELPTISSAVRMALQQELTERGLAALCEELARLDPHYHATCDLQNPKRVVHALEIIRQSGQTYSQLRRGERKQRPFRIVKLGLNRPRAELFDRINQRTTQMMDQGFMEEAKRVLPYRDCNSLNTMGYKEMFAHFDGVMDLPTTLDRIRKNTRVYAKKQLTWFGKDETIRWFHPEEEKKILEFVSAQQCPIA